MRYFKILPPTNIDFVGMRKIFFVLATVIMAACIGSILFKGLNYGIDFTGGTTMNIQFDGSKKVDIGEVRNALSSQDIDAEIQTFIDKNAFDIRVKGAQTDVNDMANKIETAIKTINEPFTVLSTDFVGPTVGSHLAKKALMAFVLSLGAMLIYIGFRFQNIIWGAMAVVALVHDVVFTAGVFSILHLEVDLVIVAAFLTVAGYSLNDTIVIFDRVRENIKLNPKWDLKKLLNVSVNETLSRTIITSFTVFVAVLVLYLMGGEVLKGFAFAMLLGTVAGVYSTVALVIGLVYQWNKGADNASLPAAETLASTAETGFTSPKKKNKKRNS